MARHSAYNKEPALTACGASLLPFRTSCKGPVNTGKVPPPPCARASTHRVRVTKRTPVSACERQVGAFQGEGDDIIEEALT